MNQQSLTNKEFESKIQEVSNGQRALTLIPAPFDSSVHLKSYGIGSEPMVSVTQADYETLIWLGINFIDTGWSFRFDEWKCAFFAARSNDEIDRVVENIIQLFRILELRIVLRHNETYAFIKELIFYISNFSLTGNITLAGPYEDDELLEHLALMFSHWANRNYPFSEVSILQPFSTDRQDGEREHADYIFDDIISVLFSWEQQQRIKPVGFDNNFGGFSKKK